MTGEVKRRALPAPAKLNGEGVRLWRKVTQTYELRPDELRILEEACREMTMIDQLERVLGEASMVVEGSMGQPVMHPAVSELRQHRAVLTRLFASLKLPDEPGGAKPSQSEQQRRAGAQRWAARGA